MILGDHGPSTTIDEDLKALGMDNLLEAVAGTGKATKAGTEKEAASRQEIGIRKEDADETDEADDVAESDEDEDEDIEIDEDDDDVEIDEDEDDDIDEDDDLDEGCGPKGKKKGKKGMAEDDDPKLDAAWDVVESFQEQLRAVQEGDNDARPDYDALVGVIEAYEYITNAEQLTERRKMFKIKGGQKKRLTRGEVKKRKREQTTGKKLGIAYKMDASGRKVRKSQAERKRAKQLSLGGKLARQTRKGGGLSHKKRSMRKAERFAVKSDEEPTTGEAIAEVNDPISELVQNLNDLREAVTQPQTEAVHDINELIEGCKAIHDTATAFYERIAGELQEAEEIDEDDARVTMGRHLEAIANDAQDVATAIAEDEEIDLEDAADDLQSLAADLNDAMEAMKEIE